MRYINIICILGLFGRLWPWLVETFVGPWAGAAHVTKHVMWRSLVAKATITTPVLFGNEDIKMNIPTGTNHDNQQLRC